MLIFYCSGKGSPPFRSAIHGHPGNRERAYPIGYLAQIRQVLQRN